MLTKEIDYDSSFYFGMTVGHCARTGHDLVAHLESSDGEIWTIVRECC